MAHKKAGGSTRNGRDSAGRRLGVKKFGGEYLIRAGEYKVIEGKWKHPRTVVIKFPSYEKALEWYNSEEYKPVKPIRLTNSDANAIIIKGV